MSINSRFHRLTSYMAAAALLAVGSSCVNEDYPAITEDGIDKNVNVLKNISLPVGSLEKVALSDILNIAEDISVLQTDEAGNLAIVIRGEEDAFSQRITVPRFTFEDSYHGLLSEQHLGDFIFVYNDIVDDYLDVLQEPREFPDISLGIEFQMDDLPTQIKDIRYAEVDALATLDLSVRINKEIPFTGYIAAGTQIVFPQWVVLGSGVEGMLIEGNVVTLNEDLPVRVATPENAGSATSLSVPVVAVDVAKLPEGQGILGNGSFLMKDHIQIKGSSFFTFDGSDDVSYAVVSPVLSALVTFTNLNINSAEILFGDEIETDIVTGISSISLEGLPDFMNDKDVVLDIDDIRLDVDFSNLSPFAGDFSAAVSTSRSGVSIADLNVGPVRFEAGNEQSPAEMHWSFSEGRIVTPEGYTLYKIDGLTDIIKQMPDLIEFKDFNLDLDKDYVTIRPGETYEVVQSYSIYAPLAFGPDFHIPYTYRIDDLDFEFDGVGLSSAILDVDVENSIPMNFTASAYFTGKKGELIEDVTFTIKDGAVLKAGSHDSPTSNKMTFILENPNRKLEIHGLVLKLEATAPDSRYVGVPLNVNQGLHFKNIVLNLPEGITADLDEL